MTGVIILNYFTHEDTLALYEQVTGFPELRILVVDNSNNPDEVEKLKSRIPEDQLLFSPENLGYAGGNNLGILTMLDHPDIDLIALLNPDIRLRNNIFPALRALFSKDPLLGVAGPRLCIRGSENTIYSDGGILEKNRFLKPAHIHNDTSVHEVEIPSKKNIDYVNGSFIMMRADAIRDVGLFDEKFFLYFEEVDWCKRAREKGWSLKVSTDLTALQSISEKGIRYNYYFFRGWFLYLHKYDKESIRPLLFHQLKKIKWKLQNKEIPLAERLSISWSRLKGIVSGVFGT